MSSVSLFITIIFTVVEVRLSIESLFANSFATCSVSIVFKGKKKEKFNLWAPDYDPHVGATPVLATRAYNETRWVFVIFRTETMIDKCFLTFARSAPHYDGHNDGYYSLLHRCLR
jgi:hypothetical protein